MVVSDNYVVRYLLQSTLRHQAPLLWTEMDGGFRAGALEVKSELEVVPSRAGERIYLSLTADGRRYWIAEPLDVGMLGAKYESEDAGNLAGLLRELVRSVALQCCASEDKMREPEDGVREMILQRLLFDCAEDEAALPGRALRRR